MKEKKKKKLETIEDKFKKLGIKKKDYPQYNDYKSFSNTFEQVTMYQKPGTITSSGSINA